MAVSLWSIAHAHGAKRIAPHQETVGYAVGLLTWALAAGVTVTAKGAADEMPPWTLVFWRLVIATLVLLPLVRHRQAAMLDLLRKRWPEALIVGALGFGITQGLLFTGLGYTSAVNTGIIFACAPIITLILARLVLNEDMGRWQMIGSIIAFGGIVVVAVRGSASVLLGLDLSIGDAIVLAAAATFAIYTVLLKRARFELERLPLLVVLLGGACLATLPLHVWEIWNGEHSNLGIKGYLALAYIAIPGGALMYLFLNWSIDILGASRAGALLYTQMIFTALLAWLVLGEPIEWYHVAGAALIILGVILITFLKAKRTQPAQAG